jgi:molybdopterin/thiamine biosynthesis adenylyltransferase/rhodanese-related sulfurtransferase
MPHAASLPLEIDVEGLRALLASGAPLALIDVREPHEWQTGILSSAVALPRAQIARDIAATCPDSNADIVTDCASGARSLAAAQSLRQMGYGGARSLRGGIDAWRRAGHATAPPRDTSSLAARSLNTTQLDRYARHLRLPEIGTAGQQRLLQSRVVCIGAGGLGSPASLYLVAAGVGHLTIVDDDRVDLSNLQRQLLHTTERVGDLKTSSAVRTLSALNADVKITERAARLTTDNALELLAGHDVIIDGSDNFSTRYIVNDAALKLGVPVVHGAVQGFEGQVSVFAGKPCYRCLFPQAPPPGAAPSCAEAGVLGVLPGVLGTLQATEAIKVLLGIGRSLAGRLLTYDALEMHFSELAISADASCVACGTGAAK